MLLHLLTSNELMAQPKRLFVIAGQSNAVGHGDSTRSPVCLPGSAFDYHTTGDTLVPLADPLGAEEFRFQSAKSGSIGPAFASEYYCKTSQAVALVSAARGGASAHRQAEIAKSGTWDTEGMLLLFPDAMNKIDGARRKTGLPVSGIIWMQGERDANAINDGKLTASGYQQAMIALIARFRGRLGSDVRFYIVQTGTYLNHPTAGYEQIRIAQAALPRSVPNVYLVYTETHQFPPKGWMTDEIHYNQTGLNHIGQTIAQLIADLEK
jgi:Carbohydrate esterase, sialic acid-specific acetylesterase